jgi:hypothetical protein
LKLDRGDGGEGVIRKYCTCSLQQRGSNLARKTCY